MNTIQSSKILVLVQMDTGYHMINLSDQEKHWVLATINQLQNSMIRVTEKPVLAAPPTQQPTTESNDNTEAQSSN